MNHESLTISPQGDPGTPGAQGIYVRHIIHIISYRMLIIEDNGCYIWYQEEEPEWSEVIFTGEPKQKKNGHILSWLIESLNSIFKILKNVHDNKHNGQYLDIYWKKIFERKSHE